MPKKELNSKIEKLESKLDQYVNLQTKYHKENNIKFDALIDHLGLNIKRDRVVINNLYTNGWGFQYSVEKIVNK